MTPPPLPQSFVRYGSVVATTCKYPKDPSGIVSFLVVGVAANFNIHGGVPPHLINIPTLLQPNLFGPVRFLSYILSFLLLFLPFLFIFFPSVIYCVSMYISSIGIRLTNLPHMSSIATSCNNHSCYIFTNRKKVKNTLPMPGSHMISGLLTIGIFECTTSETWSLFEPIQ